MILAELIQVPYSTLILQMEFTGTGIQVKRELEGGLLQFVELPIPAVLTIQSGGNQLRYATLMGIRRAKSKEVRMIAADDLGAKSVPVVTLEEIVQPRRQRATMILPGTAQEAATALVRKAQVRGASAMSILVVLENRCESIIQASWEALAVARKLGTSLNLPVVPVVLGAVTQALAHEISARHSGRIIRIEHALLEPYTPDGYCTSLQQLIQAESPAYVIFSQTYQAGEFAPSQRASVRLSSAM